MDEEKPLKDENYDDYDLFIKRTDLDFQENKPSYQVQHHEDDMDSIDSHDLLMTRYWTKRLTYQTDAKRRLMKLVKDQNVEDNKTVVAKKDEKPRLRIPYDFLFTEGNVNENVEKWKEFNKEEIDDVLKRADYENMLYFYDDKQYDEHFIDFA